MEARHFYLRGASLDLVVLLHAYMSRPEKLAALRRVVEREMPDADLLTPRLPAGWASMAKPAAIVQDVLEQIDQAWLHARPDRYRRIVLVGHSLGGLVARKAYVCACGETAGIPFEAELSARPWAARVERIALLAGMNRGWSISHHLSRLNAVL